MDSHEGLTPLAASWHAPRAAAFNYCFRVRQIQVLIHLAEGGSSAEARCRSPHAISEVILARNAPVLMCRLARHGIPLYLEVPFPTVIEVFRRIGRIERGQGRAAVARSSALRPVACPFRVPPGMPKPPVNCACCREFVLARTAIVYPICLKT